MTHEAQSSLWMYGEIEQVKMSPEVVRLTREQEYQCVRDALADSKQFPILIKATYGKVVNTLIRHWGFEQYDVVGVYKKVFAKLDTFKFQSSFGTWVCAIALNYYRDRFRRKRSKPAGIYNRLGVLIDHEARRNFYLLNDVVAIHNENGELVDLKQRESPVARQNREKSEYLARQSFNQLTNEERHILKQGLLDEQKYSEIAAHLNCTENTVRIRIHKAKTKLTELYHKNVLDFYASHISIGGQSELATERSDMMPFPRWVSPYPSNSK